jgi:hypothetical protein
VLDFLIVCWTSTLVGPAILLIVHSWLSRNLQIRCFKNTQHVLLLHMRGELLAVERESTQFDNYYQAELLVAVF